MSRHIDKEALVAAIKQSQELSDEQKADIIELIRTQKRYGLVWEEAPELAEQELKNKLPILREVKERRIMNDTDGERNPNHVLIEGENLQALVALSYTHAGMIDVIYIDPPYNTGNKDFVYNDSFIGEDDEFRHSKWLSFMEKRLKIAKNLLAENGVIFISIDDNEQANLRLLCDNIFGEKSFISSIVWQKKTGAADANGLAVITEYILVYCKAPEEANIIFAKNKEAFDIKRYRFKDEYENVRGPFYFDSLDRGSVRYSDSLNYPIIAPDGTTLYPNDRTSFVNDGWTWKWSKDKVEWGLKNGFIDISKNDKKQSGWSVRYKIYLNVDNEGNLIKKNVPYKNLITGVLNADAANDIKSIFNTKVFSFPKPTRLIFQILNFIDKKDSVVLDFFAGSGTTLHATMELNAEDGGKRQCILVTNNENGICENVTYERNKRVIQGYTTPKGEKVAGLSKNNLRYYKLKAVPRDSSIRSRMKLAAGSVDMLCIMENLYKEKDNFGDMSLYKGLRYFEEDGRGMLVLLNTDLIPKVVEQLKLMEPSTAIHIYLYAPGDYAFDDDFEEVADKVVLYPLPQPILNAYKNRLPKQDEVMLDIPDDYELSEAEQNESAKDFISREE